MGKHSQKQILSCRMTEHLFLTNYFDTSCWLRATITMTLPNTTYFVGLIIHSMENQCWNEYLTTKKRLSQIPTILLNEFCIESWNSAVVSCCALNLQPVYSTSSRHCYDLLHHCTGMTLPSIILTLDPQIRSKKCTPKVLHNQH